MRIAIVNHKNFDHVICTMRGEKISIKKNDYIIMETDDDNGESDYWIGLSENVLNKYGIEVVFDEISIDNLISTHETSNYYNKSQSNVSVIDGSESPIIKEMQRKLLKSDDAQMINYTEDELLNMSKDDLMEILDINNIKYRKNNTIKTLARLILESGVKHDVS